MIRAATVFTASLLGSLFVFGCAQGGGGTDAGGGGGLDAGPRIDAFMPRPDSGPDPVTDAGATDAGASDAGATDAGAITCPRALAAADRVRFVVVSHPYLGSAPSDRWEVLALAQDGSLSRPGTTFTMGRAPFGTVEFTRDGLVGVAVQNDGTLGVFTLDASGTPTVRHARYDGGFYASTVVMDPSGEALYVLDAQWREHGGGIYRVPIYCDGRLGPSTLVAAGRLPYGMRLLDDVGGARRAVVASKDLLGLALGPDVHLVDLDAPSVVASGDVLPYEDWIGAGFAVTANQRHVIVGDNAGFSVEPNAIAVAELSASAVTPRQVIPVADPVSIVASPFDDVVLVVSGFPSALTRYVYDAESATPLTLDGTVAVGGAPSLPYGAVLVDRGALEGLVLVAETTAVRRLRFEGAGEISHLGQFDLGESVGAIGVQP